MAAICEAVGKQMLFFHLWNQGFGRQSAFWWSGWSKCKGVKKAERQQAQLFGVLCTYCKVSSKLRRCEDMLTSQSEGMPLFLMRQLLHSSMKVQRHTHTHRRRHKHSPDVYLSVAEQFLCQSSADTDRQYGVEDACHKREKPEWNDRLSRHPSPPLPPSLTVPKHLTHSSLDCYDKPDTCQSCTHRQDGEDSSIHRSTC